MAACGHIYCIKVAVSPMAFEYSGGHLYVVSIKYPAVMCIGMKSDDFPLIDREQGIIVASPNIDGYSVDTGWYVHQIPERDDYTYARWRQADKLTKWCDSELVELPDHLFSDDPSREEILTLCKEYAFNKGVSFCKRCESQVPIGTLQVDAGYVPTVCKTCDGKCTSCGAKDWESLGRKEKHSTTSPPRWRCNECGHVKKGITTG